MTALPQTYKKGKKEGIQDDTFVQASSCLDKTKPYLLQKSLINLNRI